MKITFNNSQKLNEIVFAKRNKSYGAYAIRSAYNSTILKSLSIVTSGVFLFFIGVYLFNKTTDEKVNIYFGPNDPIVQTPIDLNPLKAVEPVKKPSGGPKTNSGPVVIVEKTDSITETHVDVIPNPNPNPNGNSNATGTLTGSGTGSVATTFSPAVIEEPTPIPVENPEFEGGLKALGDFIKNNVVYPELARGIGREGIVYVSFIIDEKGEVESSKILKGIGAGCDEEASRVVNKLPKFKKPGKNAAGKPVKVIFNIPIAFRLK